MGLVPDSALGLEISWRVYDGHTHHDITFAYASPGADTSVSMDPGLDALAAELVAAQVDTDGPISATPLLRAFDERGIQVGEARTKPLQLELHDGALALIGPEKVDLPEELLAAVPSLRGTSATRQAVASERTEPPSPPPLLDNSDKEVDHLPAIRLNADLDRPGISREELEAMMLDRGTPERVDALWATMQAARTERAALVEQLASEASANGEVTR